MKLKIILSLLLAIGSVAQARPWVMQDLSVLFPLPMPDQENELWTPGTGLQQGPILPVNVYEELPILVVPMDRRKIFDMLRVVSLRIDPCFRESFGPCQRQVRFVWQPIQKLNGQWTSIDAAIHTFHLLNDDEWNSFLQSYETFAKQYPVSTDEPLMVHPVLQVQGLRGPFAKGLLQLLLTFCKESNLIRATAMTVNLDGTVWVFKGIDLMEGRKSHTPISGIDTVAQAYFSKLKNSEDFSARINPIPPTSNTLLTFLKDSTSAQIHLSELELMEVLRKAFVASNPKLSDPGTVDCASCHVARAIVPWAEKNVAESNLKFEKEIYKGSGNLKNMTPNPGRTNVIRAFGYFDRDPVVSPRTIFESSLAVEMLNQN